jgi:hypothetical protein
MSDFLLIRRPRGGRPGCDEQAGVFWSLSSELKVHDVNPSEVERLVKETSKRGDAQGQKVRSLALVAFT